MNAVFQQCSQNLNTRQVFWNVLSVTLVTMTVMTKYDPWAYRPLSLWRPDLDSFSLLWSHVKRLSILWSYWLQTTSYLCLESLFPGAVQKNTNFRNLRWEHHLCSENDRCPEIPVFCLQVTDSDFCLKWSDVRCDWPQEVCDMVWRGEDWGAGDITQSHLWCSPIISLAPQHLTPGLWWTRACISDLYSQWQQLNLWSVSLK